MSVILFTDIDGPLNNEALKACLPKGMRQDFFRADTGNSPFGLEQYGMLNMFCGQYPEVRIVISSAWRISHTKEEIIDAFHKAHQRLERALDASIPQYMQFHDDFEESWCTPRFSEKGYIRGYEIEDWLEKYGSANQRFIIVDDDSDMLPYQKPYLIHTQPFVAGITRDHIFAMEEIMDSFASTSAPPLMEFLPK